MQLSSQTNGLTDAEVMFCCIGGFPYIGGFHFEIFPIFIKNKLFVRQKSSSRTTSAWVAFT